MTLDPHWQYLKFLYVDRIVLKRLSILPVLVEGHADADNETDPPTTRSNWTTFPQCCQCLPWIVRDPAKPDDKVLLRFTTPEHTFIETIPGEAPKRSLQVLADAARLTPSPTRLRFYDLP